MAALPNNPNNNNNRPPPSLSLGKENARKPPNVNNKYKIGNIALSFSQIPPPQRYGNVLSTHSITSNSQQPNTQPKTKGGRRRSRHAKKTRRNKRHAKKTRRHRKH